MKTDLCLAVTGLLFGTALLAGVRQAHACTPPAPPEGYFVAVTSQAVAIDDPSTYVVCNVNMGVGMCGSRTRHQGIKKELFVNATVNATPGIAGAVKVERMDQVAFILKDAAGVEIERRAGTSASFAKLGASVCVHVTWEQADTGVPSDRASELCAPVTVTNLDVTPEDLSDHQERVLKDCPMRLDEGMLVDMTDAGPLGDGGNSGAGATGGGGCSVTNSSIAGSANMLLLLGLAALASKKRRDQR
jgi:hypothetical protein